MDQSAAGMGNKSMLPNETYLRQCLETQTIDYLLSKPACFNLLAVGEDGLGKVTFLETLFRVRAAGLRDAKTRVAAASGAEPGREFGLQILTEKLCLGGGGSTTAADSAAAAAATVVDHHQQAASGFGSSSSSRLTVRLMTGVNYAVGESNRSPWTAVADFLAKQVTSYANGRAASPFDFRPEDDERVHCCLYFLPPMGGRGLRRCDALALKCLEDKVNLVPVLAKADCYTTDELAERKAAVAADLQRCGISVMQFLPAHGGGRHAVLAAIGAPHPETERCLPWGNVGVEDERFSDVPALRSLIVERNMLILRKTTKKFHSSIQKAKMAASLPRK